LTWDADDKSRKEAQARAFRGSRKDVDENDLKAYLGSDSSENEDSDDEDGGVEVVDTTGGEPSTKKLSKKEAERQRMRALLGLSAEPTRTKADGPVGEMEVTFTSGLAGGHGKDTIFENEPVIEESTIDRYVRKQRERKKRRKEKLKASKREDGEGAEDAEAADSEDNEPAPAEVQEEVQEDAGFNDPFFDDPTGKATSAARRKEEKRKKREERAAEEAASAAQRAELELLMVDDEKAHIKHFDMTEIEKAEKQAKKKGKGKGKKGKTQETAPADDFEVNVSDPRFSRLFDSHDFAIDPTNPRFKSTSGMKAMLDEGRKRRRTGDDGEAEAVPETKERSKKQKKGSKEAGSEDLKRLVDKVKRQSKA
jgi:hypothetical protein